MNIEITILGARNIKAGDLNGLSDGYIIVSNKNHKYTQYI